MTADRIEKVPHTSGPWLVSDPHPRCTSLHVLQAEKDEVGARAVVAEVAKLLDGTGHANARLIAAAPKLLEALESMVRWTEMHGLNTAELISGGRAEVPVVLNARDALEAARSSSKELAA
jgi:hypothetical protein